jgi:predicted HAD superfamily Cof-like phosphohydrolase
MFKKPQNKFSTLWRIADVVCSLLVVFYVLFDVLDLDGSDCSKVFNSAHQPKLDALVSAEAELDVSAKQFVPVSASASLLAPDASEYAQLRRSENVQFSLLRTARAHGYRQGLARNSPSEVSPDH